MFKVILPAILFLSAAAHAQPLPRNAAGELENTNAFAIGYAMSFQSFDSCGDARHGALIRKALTRWFDRCAFSAAAKAQFHAWRQSALPKMTEIAKSLHAAPRACNAITQNPHYGEVIAALDAFEANPAVLPQSILIKCDQVPVYP
jgi:hypothetical protein